MGIPHWKLLVAVLCSVSGFSQTTVLFETNFERSEGYDPDRDLAGQRGWVMQGTGGNGLIDNAFADLGQQAYIGFLAPADTNEFTSVWRPIDFNPAPANYPVVHFSVKMQIFPSTEGSQDDFRWSVYNTESDRLFSIDFETSTGSVSYVLQDGEFVPTGSAINFDGLYDLDVWIDFRRNQWSAFLNEYLLVTSAPVTQTDSALTFGDIDAVWFLRGTPAGDNYMAFDNYRITAEPMPALPGFVEPLNISTNGFFMLRAYGGQGAKYSVDVTTDFVKWFSLGEYTNTEGAFDFEDTTSKGFKQGFYRLRPVP